MEYKKYNSSLLNDQLITGKVSKKNPCPICLKTDWCKVLTPSSVICARILPGLQPSNFKFVGTARHGQGNIFKLDASDTQDTGISDREYQEYLANRAKNKAKPGKLLSLHTRDKLNRRLLNELVLTDSDKEKLLKRGLKEKDLVLYRSVTRYQKLTGNYPKDLAGIGKDGKSLIVAGDGILIPILQHGKIAGFQIRLHHDHKGGGKYRNISSEGNINLLNREGKPESPLGEYIPDKIKLLGIGITEGFLKAHLTSELLGQIILGGGYWSSSEDQLKELLEKNHPDKSIPVTLYGDAGSLVNDHIFYRYLALNNCLKKWGYILQLADWGQHFDKSVQNIDDVLVNNPNIEIKYQSWDEYASQYQGVLPVVETKPVDRQISENEYFERFGENKLQNKLENDLEHILKCLAKEPLKRRRKVKQGFGNKTTQEVKKTEQLPVKDGAIVLWRSPFDLKEAIRGWRYIPGELPLFDKNMGSPTLIYNEGDRVKLWAEAKEKGYPILFDSTGTGHGKSHDSGLLTPQDFNLIPDEDGNGGRIFYASPEHRNPTTPTLEENFTDLPSRHDGLVYSQNSKTPLGKPHINRRTGDQKADIESNCRYTNIFNFLQSDLNLPVFGGTESPVCQACPELAKGCNFLVTRKNTLKQEKQIRADLSSIPNLQGNDVVIVDEAGKNLTATKSVSVGSDEINKSIYKLKDENQRLSKIVQTILEPILETLINNDLPKWGLSHNQILALLPNQYKDKIEKIISQKGDLNSLSPMIILGIKEAIDHIIWEHYQDDWLSVKDVWGIPKYSEDGKYLGDDWEIPCLDDIKKQSNIILENFTKHLSVIKSPAEILENLKNNMLPAWLSSLFSAIQGNKYINLRIDENRKLTITKPSYRSSHNLKKAGFVVAMDATLTKGDLASQLKVNPNKILEVKETPKDYSNLTVKIVEGIGNCGSQRRGTMQNRINYLTQRLSQENDDQVMFIGRKKFDDQRYWFNHNRGSNEFKNKKILVAIGLPTPNLSQLKSEYQSLTGKIADDHSPSYWAYVQRKIISEIIQAIGRLRANQRPGEKLEFYLIAEPGINTIEAIKKHYPGVNIKYVDIYDIEPKAASKGEQTVRAIAITVLEQIKKGVKTSIKAVADTLNISRSNVGMSLKRRLNITFSQLVKTANWFFDSINNHDENVNQTNLDSDLIPFFDYLENIINDMEQDQVNAQDIITETIQTINCLPQRQAKKVIDSLPLISKCKLLAAFLTLIGQKVLDQVGDFITSSRWKQTG